MKLVYIHDVDPAPEALFQAILQRLPEVESDIAQSEVELWLTGNEEIQKLNKQYRDKDSPTDVLSFPFSEGESLGQIIISVDRAREQATELGQSLEDELQFLFTHGLLHLLGYDHQTPEEEKVMLQKAYKLLRRA